MPTLPSEPAARPVLADDCRWTCPRLWIRRASYTSSDPVGLWGQERAQESLDRFADALRLVAAPRHLDVVRSPSIRTSAADVATALGRRLGDGRTVQLVPHPTEEVLRGTGERGLLARVGGGVLVIDGRDLAIDPKRLAAVVEAIQHGASTELPGKDGAPGATHRCTASIVLIASDGARKTLREADARFDGLWTERVVLRPDLPRTPSDTAVVIALLQRAAKDNRAGEVSLGAYAFLVEQLAGRPARRERVALNIDRAVLAMVDARISRGDTDRIRTSDMEAAWARVGWRGGEQEAGHRARMRLRQLQVVTEGAHVGVTNGLMIYGSGDGAYSIPGRITARAWVGRRGLVNVEREAKYSGRSFDKGIFQLSSWLAATFGAGKHPLGVSASLVFEQSYGKVDGDSATLAEAIALLSELSGLPVRQDVAVTGAVNQRGELLPVGSVNLKIAGWWRSCRDRGPLTGSQGVLIPAVSAPDLQVDRDVLADIRDGRFQVRTARTIEEAAELLLGRPVGTPPWAPDTIFGMVDARLKAMSERLFPPRKAPPKPSGNGDGERS